MDPNFKQKSQDKWRANKSYLKRLKQISPRLLDREFHAVHDEVFAKTDCLLCANCCKTTSPIFYPTDIDRIARSLKQKPGAFIEQYLRIDDDRDYVLQQTPCPFLLDDNYCSIYSVRPKACREYPHTNRKKMAQILELTAKNTRVCPAVLEMVEKLKKVFPER